MSKEKIREMRNKPGTEGLRDLIKYISGYSDTKKMKMIEIGSYAGESTMIFADHFETVLSIDPYIENYDPKDSACKFAPLAVVYEKFKSNIHKFKNISHVRKKSDDAVSSLKINHFDFVYIDGIHRYEQVKKDISKYLPLIKNGGFLGGHDYSRGHEEVIKAVDEMIGSPDQKFLDGSWIKLVSKV